jgi:hypothetical protein
MRTMFYFLEVSAFVEFEYFKVIDFLTSFIGDNGSMSFWDWKTGYQYQSLDTTAQPGSLDAEAGLMSSMFDKTGLRLICGEADKTSKESPSQQEPR